MEHVMSRRNPATGELTHPIHGRGAAPSRASCRPAPPEALVPLVVIDANGADRALAPWLRRGGAARRAAAQCSVRPAPQESRHDRHHGSPCGRPRSPSWLIAEAAGQLCAIVEALPPPQLGTELPHDGSRVVR
jgi:hypothetical protein